MVQIRGITITLQLLLIHQYKLFRNRKLVAGNRRLQDYSYRDLEIDEELPVELVARRCYRENGYYPISFSSPTRFESHSDIKSKPISQIIPFAKYSFTDPKEYYTEYGNGFLGITQKKGGFDCFRHIEIISAGTVPLFLGVDSIPMYTMIHYPKNFFKKISADFFNSNLLPSKKTICRLSDFANLHLTSLAMCKYFSKIGNIDLSQDGLILFVDSSLSTQVDYLSVFNFIGLKQMYGDQVVSYYPEPDYVFKDSQVSTINLYGRGFGYTKILEQEERSVVVDSKIEFVIFSNLENDWGRLWEFKSNYRDSKFLLFWGSDDPIRDELLEEIRVFGLGTLFVREIR